MPTPSTADSMQPEGTPVEPVVEPGALRRSATHSAVKGQVAPRLPHERDESADQQENMPRGEVTDKAAEDLDDGKVDVQRGPATQLAYSELTAAGIAGEDVAVSDAADDRAERPGGTDARDA